MTFGPMMEMLATPIAMGVFYMGFIFGEGVGIKSRLVSGIAAAWLVALLYGAPKIHRVMNVKTANLGYFLASAWSPWLVVALVACLSSWLITRDGLAMKFAGYALGVSWLAMNTGVALTLRETIAIMWKRTRPLGLLSVAGLMVSTIEGAHVGWKFLFGISILLTLFATFLGFHGQLETWWSCPEPENPSASE
jgi:hypothetical protein